MHGRFEIVDAHGHPMYISRDELSEEQLRALKGHLVDLCGGPLQLQKRLPRRMVCELCTKALLQQRGQRHVQLEV